MEYASRAYLKDRQINSINLGIIWGYLFSYWEENNKISKQENFFRLDQQKFKLYLRRQIGMMMDYRFDEVLALWGSTYVYDYLFSTNIINEALYHHALQIITESKTWKPGSVNW